MVVVWVLFGVRMANNIILRFPRADMSMLGFTSRYRLFSSGYRGRKISVPEFEEWVIKDLGRCVAMSILE